MAPQLMWIGLGNMGRGMCKNLVDKGGLDKPLLVYNRTRGRSDELAASLPDGTVEVVDSLAEGLRRADIIFTIVSNDEAVRSVYATMLGARTSAKGKLFVDCSTVHPDTTDGLAADAAAAGAAFVASPVFGAPAAADAGQLLFVPAGRPEDVDRARPYMTGVMGRGEIGGFADGAHPAGAALRLKLLGNTFIMNMVGQLGEGFAAAEACGVGAEPLRQFVDGLFGGVYSAYGERMLGGSYWRRPEPLMSVDNARKDLRHAMSVAGAAGARLRNAETADDYLRAVGEHQGGARGDIAGMYGAARVNAGLKFENDA